MPQASTPHKARIGLLAPWLLSALLLQGCVTTEQVEALLNDSNQAIVALVESSNQSLDTLLANTDRETIAQVSGDVTLLPQGGSGDDSWLESVERIDRFIADHPQAREVNNTLRVRQASTLMMAKQLNLAAAVFDEVDPAIVLNLRDRAIYDAREALLFWYSLSGTLDSAQASAIPGHLGTLANVADGLGVDLAARRYLEQVRVRMALRLGRSISRTAPLLASLEAPIARYVSTFDGTRDIVLAWHSGDLAGDAAVQQLASLRWYDFVPCALHSADALLGQTCALEEQLGERPAACDNPLTPAWLSPVEVRNCAN